MKHAAAVAAMFALLAFPALAQHGGARGGFGGHAASGGFASHGGGFAGHAGFGGGFAAPHFGGFASHGAGFAPRFGGFAPRSRGFSTRFGSYAPHGFAPRYGGFAPRYGNFRSSGFVPRGYTGTGRAPYVRRTGPLGRRAPYRGAGYRRFGNSYSGNGGNRYGDHGRHFRHHRFDDDDEGFNGLPYASGYPYWPSYGFEIDPWSLGPDWLDSDDNSDASAQDSYGPNAPAPYPNYGEEPAPPYDESAPPPQGYAPQPSYPQPDSEPYQPQAAPSATPRRPYTGGSAAPGWDQTVTVVFKDGRAPEKIHNYMLTASTLTVLDGAYRQIPVNQIDIAATQAANRSEGVSFTVPRTAP